MIVYRERVLPSIGAIALPVLLFPSAIAIMLPLNAPLALPVAVIVTVAFSAYIYFSSPVIEVTDKTFTARGATIAIEHLGEVESIPKERSFEELGPKLDARAWLSIQASVKGLVKVEITDESDPTPYWMVSTRRPAMLVKALKAN